MPFALLSIGILLIVVAVRDQQQAFVALVGGDFSGPHNFLYWVAALAIVGAIGYIPKAKPISTLFIVLVLLVLILQRGNPKTGTGGGIFAQLQAALGTTGTPSAAGITSGSNLLSTATQAASTAAGGS